MTDRNTISQVIESLFEDWILTNKNIHPLAVENMRLLEADALALLKEQEPMEPRVGMTDEEFLTRIIGEICDFAVLNDMEPDETLSIVADNIKAILEVSTFNGWKGGGEVE